VKRRSDFEVIRRLLNCGCDPNSTVTYLIHRESTVKQTALLKAMDTGSKDLVKLLIDRGARVNHEATLGLKRTPLQKAVEVGSLEIVTLLLDAGADVNARPAERGGATAFQLAAIQGNCVIADKLLEYGANLHAPPAQINGRWPLEGAAENGRIQMIFFLWELNKGRFNIEECQKAMELAEENGYMACKGAIAEMSQKMVVALPALD
jgi:ankyrin repeat protein